MANNLTKRLDRLEKLLQKLGDREAVWFWLDAGVDPEERLDQLILAGRLAPIDRPAARLIRWRTQEEQDAADRFMTTNVEDKPLKAKVAPAKMQVVASEGQIVDKTDGGAIGPLPPRPAPLDPPAYSTELLEDREKKWKKHVQALELRGERYQGEAEDKVSYDPRRADWRRGIV